MTTSHPCPTSPAGRLRRLGLAAALTLGALPLAAQTLTQGSPRIELLPMPEGEAESRFLLLSVPSRAVPAGGYPVVLLIPDLDGPGPRTDPYATRLLENGFAVAEAHPGTGLPGSFLPEMAEALTADPRLDPLRLAALALGAGARIALREWAEGAPVAALALLYPGCDAELVETARHAAPALPNTAVLLLHGAEDDANLPEACAALAETLGAAAHATHQVLAGATFAWDATHLVVLGATLRAPHPAAPDGPRVLARPDARATLVAIDRIIAFLTHAPGLASR